MVVVTTLVVWLWRCIRPAVEEETPQIAPSEKEVAGTQIIDVDPFEDDPQARAIVDHHVARLFSLRCDNLSALCDTDDCVGLAHVVAGIGTGAMSAAAMVSSRSSLPSPLEP